jgi:hypothetical protein
MLRVETRQDHETKRTADRTRYTERTMATSQRPLVTSKTCTLPFLGNSCNPIYLPGAALRRRREVGRRRRASSTTAWRRAVVDTCSTGNPFTNQSNRIYSQTNQSNGKSIHKPIETACLHTDSSGYRWGTGLNEGLKARGFWSAEDEQQHIKWKELKAVRHAVESFMP